MRRLLAIALLFALAVGLAVWAQSRGQHSRAEVATPVPADLPTETSAATTPDILPPPPPRDPYDPAEMPEGLRLLLTKAYLPSDFNQETFDSVWRVWPEPLRTQAEEATPEERRQMAFARYGLDERPGDPEHRPMQYVVDDAGNWTMNCLSCHGGSIDGRAWPGLPNTHYALDLLTREIRLAKLARFQPLARMEIGSMFVPLGETRGTTNAVMFGVVLMAYRDAELNVYPNRLPPRLVNHDMDAPPWWHFAKRDHLYIDNFAPKSHRALMPFLMVEENGPEKFTEWEEDFQQIYAWLESIEPPAYPREINAPLAAQGELVFNTNCSHCHGTYGEEETWPEVVVPLEEIGTDPVRLSALSVEHRTNYAASWFTHFDPADTVTEPTGYVAPPLDGIWASAPYLHNGSVPTLWHMLHPAERPALWKRQPGAETEYDWERVGLAIETLEELPAEIAGDPAQRLEYFDTSGYGKSAAGHTFPDLLTPEEKAAVLEYLKTL